MRRHAKATVIFYPLWARPWGEEDSKTTKGVFWFFFNSWITILQFSFVFYSR